MKQRYNVWYGILTALPVVAVLSVFPFYPETIPAHYNLYGEIDRWGSRLELLILPAGCSLTAILFYLILRVLRKKGNTQNVKVLKFTGIAVLVLFNGMNGVIAYQAYRGATGSTNLPEADTLRVVSILLSLLFIVMGNLLPKCRQNAAFGIRVKWTLQNEEVWYHTHRLGGKMMVASGFLCLLLCAAWLQGLSAMLAVLAVLIAGTVVECVYARRLYRKLEGANKR